MTHLAILLCDTPLPPVVAAYGTYVDIFRTLLITSLSKSKTPDHPFTFDGYDVVGGIYPSDEQLAAYDGILISGSSASAYAPLAWIPPLLAFLSKVVSVYPKIKVVGICFGQQVIARALGGECVPSEKGWEVGVYDVELTAVGQSLFGTNKLRIQQMHRDLVPTIPPNFQLLGSTPKCAVQGIALPYGTNINSLSDVHVLCVQGHPEFLPDIVQKMINIREAGGILDQETAKDARYRAEQVHDGVDVVAKTVWKMFGVIF